MRHGLLLVWVMVMGCYTPDLPEGFACTDHDECPHGLTCDPATITCVSHVTHCAQWSDFGSVQLLAGLATPAPEVGAWLSPENDELWFQRVGDNPSLYRSTRDANGAFTAAVPVNHPDDENPFNAQVFLSGDRLTLWYNSDKAPPSDLLRRHRASTTDEFDGSPVRELPDEGAADAAFTPDQLRIVVAVHVGPSGSDLRLATRAAAADTFPHPDDTLLRAVNSAGDDCCATISADGNELIFESDRDGRQRVFRSTRASNDDAFGAAVEIGGLPDTKGEAPMLARDGTTLVFSAPTAPRADEDLYVATRTCLVEEE